MVKPGNAAKERWQGARGECTPLAILYLHGFSASTGEAGDLPGQMAKALGANLYMPLWPGHGEDAPDAIRGLADTQEASVRAALDHACVMRKVVVIVAEQWLIDAVKLALVESCGCDRIVACRNVEPCRRTLPAPHEARLRQVVFPR